MSITDSNNTKKTKNIVTEMPSKIFPKEEKAHITIPIEKEINEEELVNLVASFICAHEDVPIENASIGQDGNNYFVQVKKGIPGKKGLFSHIEIFTVQFKFMPKVCIVDFITNRGKVEKEKLKKTAEKAVIAEAGLIGVAALVTSVSTGVLVVGLSPLALALLPVAGATVTVNALSANGKKKKPTN